MAKGEPGAPLLLVAAAAMVDGEGRVLLQRRPPGKAMAGLWEFPGGKVEPGETPELALARELAEELDVAVAAEALRPACFATDDAGGRRLLLLLYLVERWDGAPRAVEASELAWVRPANMRGMPMPPADEPLVGSLEVLLARTGVEARAGIEPACKDLQSSA